MMRRCRPTAFLAAALFLNGSCAASGIGSPGAASVDRAPSNQREIERSEFRFQWPFSIGTGTLACDAGAITFLAAGVAYGLNDEAIARGFTSPVPILRTRSVPPTNPLGRVSQNDRQRIFRAALACDGTGDTDSCRSRIASQYRLSTAELTQVVAEGRERHWPPLEPLRMSVDPIVEAGRLLCR